MKISFTALATLAVATLFCAPAAAQSTTRTTSDYQETQTQGNQIVKFETDNLPATANDPYAGLIHGLPRSIRAGLLKPRMNFVPELLKSVENL